MEELDFVRGTWTMTGRRNGAAMTAEERVSSLLAAMTTAEKFSLLAGASMWLTTPVERLGIPAIKVSDGPNGVRGDNPLVGAEITAACFPAGIALAATWNTGLIERIGEAVGEEATTKGANLILGPTINIHRHPLNGRNFECFSEDPYLSARIAVAYITGLQRQNVGATPKHFVCNDSEFQRQTISSEVDERTLREIYLPPFEAAVREAGTWAVMAGYNRVNGVYAGENRALLTDLLKREWGHDGIVMSDWFGLNSTVDAANNGLDLEMPGPPHWRGDKLLAAVEAGEIDPAAIDEAARRVLRLILRSGASEESAARPEQAIDRPEHRALIRTAAAEGMVLLKNAGNVLPLNLERLTSIAVIGPNAKTARIYGGGSAQLSAHYAVSPFDGIVAQVGDRLRIGYELGCGNYRQLPRLTIGDGRPSTGFTLDYFPSLDLTGAPAHSTSTTSSEQFWIGEIAPGVTSQNFSARLATTFTPLESGAHAFSLTSAGRTRLLIDGEVAIDNWTQQTPSDYYFGFGSTEVINEVNLTGGRRYEITVEYSSGTNRGIKAIRLGYLAPVAADAIDRAADLAARSDVALLFVGLNADWEGEGIDRPDMELVGDQVELIERVAAANPNTVVVLQTGSPITMPWLDRVPAVLQAWYPGQECGNAIADVLFGAVNPSGKLPQTFPVRLEDNPAYINYPGDNGRVRYGEGIYVGYRYYEKKRVAPLFPFGFGLSYTDFAYANLSLNTDTFSTDQHLTVTIDVTNTGDRAGQEVVQLYVRDAASRVSRPDKELKAFAKLSLVPGEMKTASFALDRQSLAFWDDADHTWLAEAGDFDLLIGSSSADIRARAPFRLTETVAFGGPS
jgi:beta-glucosidase